MALAERTWERVGERKRDRLIESTAYITVLYIHVYIIIQVYIYCSNNIKTYNTIRIKDTHAEGLIIMVELTRTQINVVKLKAC